MRYRMLGNTGLRVSEIGFGTIPILSGDSPVLPEYFSPDVDTAVDIMRRAYEMGCNLFDTAIIGEYGDAEYKLGVFAASVARESIVISDKARRYGGEEMRQAVLSSCETLGTHVDVYFVHQVEERNAGHVFGPGGALDALCQLKREGRIRFVGVASHYFSVLERAAEDPRVDVLQGSGNILECGVIRRLQESGAMQKKGFLLNKVYAAGLLTQEFMPEELIGGVLDYPVSSILIGVGTHEQAMAAMSWEYAPRAIGFEDAYHRLSSRYELIACDRCQRCVCQRRHEIHSILRYFNYMKLGKAAWAREKLRMFVGKARRHCQTCRNRSCEATCPRQLPIPELMAMIDREIRKPEG